MSLDLLVREVFNGTPSLVVRHLVDSGALSEGELVGIRSLRRKRQERK
jgi:hypothetical protein